jgi:hypothetical protein
MNYFIPRSMPHQEAFRALSMAGESGFTPKDAMSCAQYDDQEAVDWYVALFWTRYLGEYDKRCYDFGLRLAKAQDQPESPWGQQVLAEWQRCADQGVREALADGFPHLQERLWQKVLVCFRTSKLLVNRCPKCNRVVRTPRARQCLWCGNDWHE